MKLKDFLLNKPIFYKNFDPLRMGKAYAQIKKYLKLPRIIHIIGTNGKGSTGRYLAHMLNNCNINVGHYSSPHIIHFNERIWINGDVLSDLLLEQAFNELMSILSLPWQKSLSYFEFTTFLALIACKKCEFIILEAGLGGEYDATSVFENELTLITPIGVDHTDLLGSTIKEIATTKIRAVQKIAVVAKQKKEVNEVLYSLSKILNFKIINIVLKKRDKDYVKLFKQTRSLSYLVNNFSHALATFRYLGFENDIEIKNIPTIFGRLTKINENLFIDVGHNLLAAKEIFKFFGKSKVNLVYNCLADKDYKKILTYLKPIINKVFIIKIRNNKAVDIDILKQILKELGIEYETFTKVDKEVKTLVFGSFIVVEAFLKIQKTKMNLS